jgi:DME family drug/metabolite transporter
MAVEPVVAAPPGPTRPSSQDRLLGYAFGVLTAMCWATSPILIRKGLKGLPSPTWGVTVGMAAATAMLVAWVVIRRPPGLRPSTSRGQRRSLGTPLTLLLICGVVSALGSIGRTVAIDLAPVVVVLPLVQTASLFTVILAPLLLGRHVEHVPPRLLFGAILMVVGSSLVIVGLYR